MLAELKTRPCTVVFCVMEGEFKLVINFSNFSVSHFCVKPVTIQAFEVRTADKKDFVSKFSARRTYQIKRL